MKEEDKEQNKKEINDLAIKFQKTGDEEAFLKIMNDNNFMFHYFYNKYKIKDLKDKDEFIQQCMVFALEALDKWNNFGSVISFINLVVERKLIRKLDKQFAQRRKYSLYTESLDEELQDEEGNHINKLETLKSEYDLFNEIEKNERYENVQTLIKHFSEILTKKELNCLLLTHYVGFTYSETAKELNIKIKSVDNSIQRSIQKIKTRINYYEYK